MKKWFDIVGWCGAVLLLAAFALNSFGYLGRNDATYQLMNLFGAVGILLDAYKRRDYPAAALNVVWAIIAIGAIVALLR